MVSALRILLIGVCALALANDSMQEPIPPAATRSLNVERLVLSQDGKNVQDEFLRDKRAPQFGPTFEDYSDYGESRHFGHGHKKHRRPYYHGGGYGGGCRGYDCSQGHGWRPQQGGYYNQGPTGSQASASAGAGSGSPFHNGGAQSQANAQSATFSLGPYSASFSSAQASAGSRGRGPLSFFN